MELILEKLAAGESVEQILKAHPRLTEEGIRAALAFASEALKADVVYLCPAKQQMNFIADESVDGSIVESLRKGGHQVIYVTELDPGLNNEEVLRSANDSGAILITAE